MHFYHPDQEVASIMGSIRIRQRHVLAALFWAEVIR